jgi:predicted transcriptional regulator
LEAVTGERITERQRQVLTLHLRGRTQAEIAKELGISQPAVSQHLIGKRRDDKVVGGALKRIGKLVRKAVRAGVAPSEEALVELLRALSGDLPGDRKASDALSDLLASPGDFTRSPRPNREQ